MTPLVIALMLVAAGAALLLARQAALRDAVPAHAVAVDAAGVARFAGQPRERRPQARPAPSPAFTRPSDLAPKAAPQPLVVSKPAPAPQPIPAKEEPAPADEPRATTVAVEDTRPSSEEIVIVPERPADPELSAAQRERIERLMSAVKAEFSTLKKKALEE